MIALTAGVLSFVLGLFLGTKLAEYAVLLKLKSLGRLDVAKELFDERGHWE